MNGSSAVSVIGVETWTCGPVFTTKVSFLGIRAFASSMNGDEMSTPRAPARGRDSTGCAAFAAARS